LNSSINRNIWISCGVLALAACLCLSLLAVSGVGVGTWEAMRPTSTATPTRIPITPRPSPTPDPSQPISTPFPTPSGAALPAETIRQMAEIEQQVAEIRGLQPIYPVPRYLLTRDQLRQRVLDDFLKDYTPEDARDEALTLAAFGLLEPGFDLRGLLVDLYTEQIAGFYDDEAKAMFVIQEGGFRGMERQTYAHEYAHALQDMYFGLSDNLQFTDTFCQNNSDPCSAVQSLIEGDATWVGNTWLLEAGTDRDRQDLLEFAQNYSSPAYDAAPKFLQEAFLFPYQRGLEFVQTLQDQAGLAAVDQAFANPPDSSEQILHPQGYPSDRPQTVTLPDLSAVLGEGWRELDNDSLGEYSTYQVLALGAQEEARLPETGARQAAAGWDGDRYAAFANDAGQAFGLVLVTAWDTDRDAAEFINAMRQYGTTRWGAPLVQQTDRLRWETAGQVVQVELDAARTVWIMAPDPGTLDRLASAVGQ